MENVPEHPKTEQNPLGAGRPTAYKPKFVTKVLKMAEDGATDMEIADNLGVSVRTLYRWKAVHPKFSQALKIAKDAADDRVERSLYHSALGGERRAVKIFLDKDDKPIVVPYREVVPPNPTSVIFWLKNRRSDKWRDWKEHEHKGTVSLEMLVAEDDDDGAE